MAIENGTPRHVGMRRPEPQVREAPGARSAVPGRSTGAMDRPAEAARAAAVAERRRLARELHDSVSQTVIGLQLTAQAAAELWDTEPAQARAALDTLRHLAVGATTELRAMLVDLHEATLEEHGLVAALEAYCAVVRQRSGLQVEVRVGERGVGERAGSEWPGARLPAAHQEALYRIVQEALVNVVKHSRATQATVTLVLDAAVRVCVEDDGVGFRAPAPAFSYGLAGMRERVAALGGRLQLDNGPAGGARVIAELPVGVAPQAVRGRISRRTPQPEGYAGT